MVIEFSVKNFRSINELQTLSFATTGLKSTKKNAQVDSNNIIKGLKKNISLFKTLGIYGANASGKSNVIKALDYFITILKSEPSTTSSLGSLCQPYFFQDNPELTESFFQIVLLIKNRKYRYGLTVKKNTKDNTFNEEIYSDEIITNEWLYAENPTNMSVIFEREGNVLTKNNLKNANLIPSTIPYEHTLYLTFAAAFDNEGECKTINDYYKGFVTSNFEFKHDKYRWMTINIIKSDQQDKILNLLSSFDLYYDNINLIEHNNEKDGTAFPLEKIELFKNDIKLNLKEHESTGTQKMFDLVGLLILTFSLKRPAFIILDEIDSNFHPALLIKLINLFNNPAINLSNSQLVFTSHDTNLLSPSIMRRDQFYFTEKKITNSTHLYSLADLKGIKNDADFAKQYLAGLFGALPVLHNYSLEDNSLTNIKV